MPVNAPPGHFMLLYFASASSFTSKDSEAIEAPLPLSKLFDHLEMKYPGIIPDKQDGDQGVIIQAGDEVAIIPPVSSG
jgi:molybdopterin converting factor small subunit